MLPQASPVLELPARCRASPRQSPPAVVCKVACAASHAYDDRIPVYVAQLRHSLHIEIPTRQTLLPSVPCVVVQADAVVVHYLHDFGIDRIAGFVGREVARRGRYVTVVALVEFPVQFITVGQVLGLPFVALFVIGLIVVADAFALIRTCSQTGGTPVFVGVGQRRFLIIEVAIDHDAHLRRIFGVKAAHQHFRKVVVALHVSEAIVAGIRRAAAGAHQGFESVFVAYNQ